MKNVALVAAGVVMGVVVTISCSDDSPPRADAAVQCDCPVSEAPIKERLVRVASTRAISAMSVGGDSAGCPQGAIVISGGCLAGTTDAKHVLLSSVASPVDNPIAWECFFYNGTAAEVTSTATVLCLKPAP